MICRYRIIQGCKKLLKENHMEVISNKDCRSTRKVSGIQEGSDRTEQVAVKAAGRGRREVQEDGGNLFFRSGGLVTTEY